MGNILRIGLTGGIGSGKSTACNIFSELGVPVIDADQIAHELTIQGKPAYQAIIGLLGDKIICADGELDRAQLREIIFDDDDIRHKVEGVLHPLIYNEIENQVSLLESNYCIICIPLLIETGATGKVDRILVIDTTEEQQILRASCRDKIDNKTVEKIRRKQVSRDKRLSFAHDIIYNEGDIESLRNQIYKLNDKYNIASDGK